MGKWKYLIQFISALEGDNYPRISLEGNFTTKSAILSSHRENLQQTMINMWKNTVLMHIWILN